jgi:hypothetical protein
MIESLRSFGYNLQTAIADLLDNSISAQAKNIWLNFCWDGTKSYVSIRDDGCGMTEAQLSNAMRPGSQNPIETRKSDDLGRFGLGLKTASFSQCRRLTVASRAENHEIAIRRWDLDYVHQVDEWRLLRSPAEDSAQKLNELTNIPHGTVVLWEFLDRVVGEAKVDDQKAQDNFLETVEVVENHTAMVFHRFLENPNRLKIWINHHLIEPWNPFLTDAQATQILPLELLTFKGETVQVQPYVLPHHSKLDSDTYSKAAGLNGWNAQQGFYVYRNERLLVAGDWLSLGGYRKDEHCKLARIQVDLPNSMDSDWNIDIKKSRARPPASLKADLKRIARLTRYRATEIYRHRGKVLARENSGKYVFAWDKKLRRGKVFYGVNQEHPLVQEVLKLPDVYQPAIRALLRLLEETVPVQQIWIDNTEPEKQAQPFDDTPSEQVLEVMVEIYRALRKSGMTQEQARDRILKMEPFQHFDTLIKTLSDQLIQGNLA